jgi:dTDP-4-amino-4,6-dideoxygalactose transaminase
MSNVKPIPFSRVATMGREMEYVMEAYRSGQVVGDGPFTRRAQELLRKRLGVPCALITTSCTHALEMSALLLDIAPGDEVIMPTFTFVSTANAFALRGAKPVFVDSHPVTLNLDERQLERLITPRTRAIVPVHYAGVACEMNAIMDIANARRIAVVEDNAHGFLGRYGGRELGTFGAMSALSFHSTKNVACGEGGALIVNDPALAERAEILREKGTNRSRFLRGQVDKYTWVDIGSSYVTSDAMAAFLLGQLESEAKIQASRRRIWQTYQRELAGWAQTQGVTQPVIPDGCEHSWHIYHLLLPSLDRRQALIAHLAQRQITAVFHYIPLHSSPMGLKLGPQPSLPVAEAAAERLLRLPLYNDMSDDDLARVVDAVKSFR